MSSKIFQDMKSMLRNKKIRYPLYIISCIIISYLNYHSGVDVFSIFETVMHRVFGIGSHLMVLIIYFIYYYIIWAALTMIVLGLVLYTVIRLINFIQSFGKKSA